VGVPISSVTPGVSRADLSLVGSGGIGDGFNSYAHAMFPWKGKLYVGVSRCVFQSLALHHHSSGWSHIKHWPVDYPSEGIDGLYTQLDRRGQIWSYDLSTHEWKQIFVSPSSIGNKGERIPREFGYRCMVLHRWPGELEENLYITATATGRGPGSTIIQLSSTGEFHQFGDHGLMGLPVTSVRSLVSFKGALFAAPSGARGSRSNSCDYPAVFRCSDPSGSVWTKVSLDGFGDSSNITVFTLYAGKNYLYAGTLNNSGCQVWRTDAEIHDGLCHWECIASHGAGRGTLNQAVASMCEFNNALYVGTGIQNGGFDIANNIGPAAGEIFRINSDDSISVVVGSRRKGELNLTSISGLAPGFGNPLNGYIWSMCSHDGWLYAGTCNIGVMLEYVDLLKLRSMGTRLLSHVGVENIVNQQAGAELWRSPDGENWVPVSTGGIGNKYNLGVRNLISSNNQLIIGTANPFGPTVYTQSAEGNWVSNENPRGGFELFISKQSHPITPSLPPQASVSNKPKMIILFLLLFISSVFGILLVHHHLRNSNSNSSSTSSFYLK